MTALMQVRQDALLSQDVTALGLTWPEWRWHTACVLGLPRDRLAHLRAVRGAALHLYEEDGPQMPQIHSMARFLLDYAYAHVGRDRAHALALDLPRR